MRAAVTLISSLAMALAAIGLAIAAPRGSDPRLASATVQAASGAVTITNSRAGDAIFGAAAMRPGEGVSGSVRIGNAGDVAGTFAVRGSGVHDTPGPNGGRLSERVELVLLDVTDAQRPLTLFSGHPAELAQVDLGTLAAGEAREYRFSATLPDGGEPGSGTGGDNRYQGSGLSLGFEWRAEAVSTPTPTPTPTPATPTPATPTASVPTPAKPAAPVDYAGALGLPPATRCVKRGRLSVRLKAPDKATVVSATVAVNGRVTARVKGAKARKPVSVRGLRKATAVTLTVRASNGRTYTGTRKYTACR
jgi:spore coat-associated protein N